MKTKALSEPKQRKAFQDKYPAAVLAVAALLISSIVSAQTDSLKYSQINGYGFKYKRMAFDSVLMIPLSTSPHAPYRMGALRYKAADSTLQLWTGYQWNSILTGVGNGVDTAYAYDDSTLAIETPNRNYFVKIKGKPSATQLNDSTFIVGDDTLTIHGTGATPAITQLTGDVTAGPGSGSQVATIAANAVTTSKINDGAVTIPKINATGTADGTTVLYGNGTWAPPGGGNQGFQDVLTNNPDLSDNDTVNHQAYRLYFTNGQLQSDSVILTPTQSFMSTDTIKGFGHSIANYLGASSFANSFIGLTATHFNKPWANWAQISSGITRVVWQHNSHIGPNDQNVSIVMGGLNTIRAGWTNIKTYRKLVNGNKTIVVNQFSAVQDSASGANVTRSGSGWSTYAGQADAAKFNTTAYTNVANDSATYNFTGPGVAVVMMGADSSASNYIGSDVQIKIDGVSQGTFATNNQTDGVTDFISGFPGHLSPMAFIFHGLKDTSHVITVINTQSHYMYIDYFATFVSPTNAYPLVIMHEPYMNSTGYAGQGSNALIDAFNHGTDSMVATLPHVLPVYVGKTNTVYNAGASTSDIAGDGIHPNDLGHTEIFTYSVLPAIEHASAGKMLFTNNSLYINDGTQYRKVYDTANLLDATATIRGLVGVGNQTWAGTKTFLKDIIVNSVRIGNGAGNYASNTFVGSGTGLTNNGDNGNTALGQDALVGVSTGYFNTAIGRTTLANTGTGATNTALGHAAGNLNTGSGNVFLGYSAGSSHTTGSNQLYIANNSSSSLIWGSFANNRVVIGSPGSPSDNGVGTLQVRGKLTVDEHAVASNSDSAVVWNRSTNAYEVAKINSGGISGSGTSGRVAYWNGSTSVTSASNFTFDGNTLTVSASGSATGIDAGSSTGYGGNIHSSSGPGLQVSSSSNTGLIVSSTSGVPAEISTDPSSTNTTIPLMSLYRKSSATAATNIAGSIDLYNENGSGSDVLSSKLVSKLTTVTGGSEVSQFEIWGLDAGTSAQKLTLKGSGQLQLNNYGSGTITGTTASLAGFTSTGNIIEVPLNGSFGSVVVINDADHTVTSTESAIRYHNNITASRTLTIPNPSAATDREIWVKWNTISGGGSLNITTTSGTALIYLDGTASSSTYNINTSNQSALLKSDGTSWYKIN